MAGEVVLMQRLIDPNATWQDIARKVRLMDDECDHLQRQVKLLHRVNAYQRARIAELGKLYKRALVAAVVLGAVAVASLLAHA